MKYTDTPPYAPTLMESTRAIGYLIESAIADIIDNSIAANATTVDIDFFPIGEAYISILDNGYGMNETELINAMKYGSQDPLQKRDEVDLGRYGLGMKTASLSQCRILTVISKKNGSVSAAQWNLDHIKSAGTWSLILLDESDIARACSHKKSIKNHCKHNYRQKNRVQLIIASTNLSKTFDSEEKTFHLVSLFI